LFTQKRIVFWLLSSLVFSYIPYSYNVHYGVYLGLYIWLFSLFVIVDYYADKWYPQPQYTWDKPRQVLGLYVGLSCILFVYLKDIIL
jgi:hypothetical protein